MDEMIDVADFMQEDRRLVILRVLYEIRPEEANESILERAIESYGHKPPRHILRMDIGWLQQKGLISVRLTGEYMIAKLAWPGMELVEGRSKVKGVKSPRRTL